jgi:hypothetical protein
MTRENKDQLGKKTQEEFKEYMDDFYSENFDKLFNKPNLTFAGIFFVYNRCLETLVSDLTENLYFLMSGCTFEMYNLKKENGKPITADTNPDEIFKALEKDYVKKKLKLDTVFLKYMNQVEKPESITDFPKNADKNDKEILDKLAKEYLILRELSDTGKYDMTMKNLGRKIARFLLENKLIKNSLGAVFMNMYINHGTELSTLANYFREIPKDLPK